MNTPGSLTKLVLIYLFIKLNSTIKIKDIKQYLTKWFRSWGPLKELKTIAIRILHKGKDGRTPFSNWPWFTGDDSTLCSNVFNHRIDLRNQKLIKVLDNENCKVIHMYLNQNDAHILSCNSKMSKASPNIIFVDSIDCKLT